MRIEAAYFPSGDFSVDAARIARLEADGFAAVWALPSAHNPFFALSIAAASTITIQLGVMDDAAFSRSPMVTAQIAWDLSRQSDGRFQLGLGIQPPAHSSDAFDEDFSDPVGRTREYIESLRAIWRAFQTGERLRYRGQHYQFRLMAPFFNPGPIDQPRIPIWLTTDGSELCALAAELCAGLHGSPLQSGAALQAKALPALHAGLRGGGRTRDAIEVAASVFVVSDHGDASATRWRRFVEKRIRDRLAARSDQSQRDPDEIDLTRDALSEETLREIAIVAEPALVMRIARERYAGLADRLCLIWDPNDDALRAAIAADLDSS